MAELTRTSQLLSGWTPAIDLFEDKDNVYVKAELPGMKKEEILDYLKVDWVTEEEFQRLLRAVSFGVETKELDSS